MFQNSAGKIRPHKLTVVEFHPAKIRIFKMHIGQIAVPKYSVGDVGFLYDTLWKFASLKETGVDVHPLQIGFQQHIIIKLRSLDMFLLFRRPA